MNGLMIVIAGLSLALAYYSIRIFLTNKRLMAALYFFANVSFFSSVLLLGRSVEFITLPIWILAFYVFGISGTATLYILRFLDNMTQKNKSSNYHV